MVDVSQYKVGMVLSLEGCGGKCANGKALKACRVRVTADEGADPVTIVTSASNVRTGSRVVVALAGTSFLNGEGEEVTVQRTSVGGVASDGILCDSRMLGWSGGGSGVAAQVPDSFEIGSAPPSSKPRPKQTEEPPEPTVEVQGLFEKKLSKEEKKRLAEERRKARKAAKEAKKEGTTPGEPTEGQ
jgi:tRNA-binding EMAP/Myf-like protein